MNTSYYNKSEVLEQQWRFSPLDFLTILLAIVSSGTGIFFLLTYEESISPLRDLTPIAKVGSYSQSPQRKIVGTLSWNGVKSKEVLFRGDQILTDEYSKVEVIFLDKTFLNVPPSSLIKLDFNNGEFDIELVKGFLDINLASGNEKVTIRKGKQKYQLNSKNGKVQVLSGGKGLKFKTLKGDVKIGGKTAVKRVSNQQLYEIGEPLKKKVFNPLNEKVLALNLKPQAGVSSKNVKPPEVVLSRYADLRKVQKLKIKSNNLEKELKLKLPKPGMYFLGVKEPGATEFKITPFQVMPYNAPKLLNSSKGKPLEIYEGEKIPIAWTGRKDLPYEVQVKQGKKTRSLKMRGTQALVPIFKSTNVQYRVRVGSSAAPWSDWQGQKVIVKPGLLVDKKQTPDLFIKKKPQDSLALSLYKRHKSPKGFAFEISKDKEFKEILTKKKVSKPSLKWSNLTPGVYFWRATTLDSTKKTTGPQKLIVKAPAISVPKNYKKNVITTKSKPKVNVSWQEQIPNTKYKLQVLDQNNKPVVEKEVTGSKAEVELPQRGLYSWKIEPLQNKEFLLESPKISLNVDLPPPLESPKIDEKQVIYYRYINGVEAYEIELPEYKHAEFYYLEVFKDPQLKNLLFKKAFPNNRGYWVSNRSGKYYYRVRVTDKWGRKSRFSKVGILIFPISPLVKE